MALLLNNLKLKFITDTQKLEITNRSVTIQHTQIASNEYFKTRTLKVGSKKRSIDCPSYILNKRMQAEFLKYITAKLQLHPAAMASAGNGIVANAAVHKDAKHILKIDIKNFFESINDRMVLKAVELFEPDEKDNMLDLLYLWGINRAGQDKLVSDKWYGDRWGAAPDRKYILPTGARSSPHLANFVMKSIDIAIDTYVKSVGGNYTRYLDDFIVSFDKDLTHFEMRDIKNYVSGLITGSGFTLHKTKTKWINFQHDKLIVAGIDIRNSDLKVNNKNIHNTLRPLINSYFKTFDFKESLLNPPMFGRYAKKHIEDNAIDWYKEQILSNEIKGHLSYIRSVSFSQYQKILSYIENRIKIHSELKACPDYLNKLKERMLAFPEIDKARKVMYVRSRRPSFNIGQKFSTFEDTDW